MAEMDMKEKLVELLGADVCKHDSCDNCECQGSTDMCIEALKAYMADHLIANGVTFATDNNVGSKWIPVTERLPTIYDADADNCVLAIHKASNKRYYHWRSVADNPFDFTHWMPLPQPPKGE